MAEESSTGTPPADAPTTKAKKTRKAERAPSSSSSARPVAGAGTGDGVPGGWRTWGIVGLVLVGGVVAWRLAGATYKSDLETMCNAEKGSGLTVEKDQAKVTQWVREHLSTPEGNEFFSSLGDARGHDRATKLRGEADAQHVGSCPMVASYEQLAAQGEYRSDLQRLCSSLTFPKLAEMDDATRLSTLLGYIDTQAKSPRTKELEDPLRQAASPADRARVLRDAGAKMDVFTCEAAKTLESPQAAPKPAGPAMVRVRTTPQINGPLAPEDLARGVASVTPAMNECYQKGLERKADLGGKLTLKLKIDPSGAVMQDLALDQDRDVTDKEAVACIGKALKSMKLQKNAGPLVTVLLPLELVPSSQPATVPPPPGALTATPAPARSPMPASSQPRAAP